MIKLCSYHIAVNGNPKVRPHEETKDTYECEYCNENRRIVPPLIVKLKDVFKGKSNK